ncbi:MAG: glycosyltransferase, partial [Phenylobacterium sp.]|nr:glycosyltransferase [Phenylobacterium sp.]
LISLHRAEGFGLTPSEALALRTPVVATGWSGVTDFLDETVAVMIGSSPTPVEDSQGIYAGQSWAEPDLDQAAAALRALRADPERRAKMGAAGRARVAERLSPQAWFTTLPDAVKAAAMRAAQGR